MQRVKKFLNSVDMFGAYYEFTLINDEPCYKSIFGGISSIVIYSLSVAYAIYMLTQYFQGQVLPKITYQETFTDYLEANYVESPFKLNFLFQEENIDPFQKQNNILTPFLLTFDLFNVTSSQILFPNETGTSTYSSSIEKANFDLVINVKTDSSEFKAQRQQLLILARCQDDLLKLYSNDSSCASDDVIAKFMSKTSKMVINLSVQLQQYVTSEKTIKSVRSQNYLIMNQDFMTYSEVRFQNSEITVSDGLVVASQSNYLVNSNVDIITQSLTTNYYLNFDPRFSIKTSYASFLMRLDSSVKNTEIEYILIGAVLADILSIIEVLFWGSFLAQYLNGVWLKRFTIREILQSYFPQLKDYQFHWNYKGQLQLRNQQGEFLESVEDNQLFSKLTDQTQQKQELIGIFQNLAKIEMLLEVLVDHHAIEAGELGYQLPKFRIKSNTQSNEIQMQELDTSRSMNTDDLNKSRTISRNNTQTLIAFRRFGQNDRVRFRIGEETPQKQVESI